MKVVKFGGSSLASAEQIKKVLHIIAADPDRRVVVVSAPGKRDDADEKVTDMLIQLAQEALSGVDYSATFDRIVARYAAIAEALSLEASVVAMIEQRLTQLVHQDRRHPEYFIDALKASGEDNNARLVAAYFTQEGVPARYVNPQEAGLWVSDTPGNATVLPEAYEALYRLREYPEVVIFPGFFGYTRDGRVVTFSRGGSDITGAIVARGVRADMYENFTDVPGIYAANPSIVHQPVKLDTLTYREMRELSYAGFSVFHDEALQPAFSEHIPVHVKNTNDPAGSGTLITKSTPHHERLVSGIASVSGIAGVYVSKYLMNRAVGFGSRLLAIFAELGLSYEHIPSGIDELTVLLRQKQLTPELCAILQRRIKRELGVDEVTFRNSMALVVLVGEGMAEQVGTLARATRVFAEQGINVKMINQGSSEVSIIFGIAPENEHKAVRALYREFFG